MRDRPLRQGDGYERPQQKWHCGLAEVGPACPLGPTGSGHCPAAAACHPVRVGERWHCNRSELRGGPCAEGPGHDGTCAIVYRCTPVRSMRSRRGRFVFGVAIAALGALAMGLSGSWRNELIAPGRLSAHHAQLLEGGADSARCATCHAAGGATLEQWWSHSSSGASLGATQTALCMKCHDKSFDPGLATAAHNWAAFADAAETGAAHGSRLRDPAEPIACSACHREHQGAKHDLAAVADNACQACHRERFDSFGDGHPEFTAWPAFSSASGIAFDHASHQHKHFPAEKHAFACAACHRADAASGRQLTLGYEATCAACHDKSIAASLIEGVPLLALPTLDIDVLTEAGRNLSQWPEAATGDFEGAVSPPAMLLMATEPPGAALAALAPTFDFFDLDLDDERQVAAAADAAEAIRRLSEDLANRGQAAIAERLSAVLGRSLTKAELDALSGRLSPDALTAFQNRWFGEASTEALKDTTRDSERAKVAAGGWRRDDLTLSLRYQPIGHADPWLRAWVDVIAEAAGSNDPKIAEIAKPLLVQATRPTGPGQCGSCHQPRQQNGKIEIPWHFPQKGQSVGSFTRFSHTPHLLQPSLRDCNGCHRIAAPSEPAPNSAPPTQHASEFAPIAKASCAECHAPRAAGEACTQCHRYHNSPLPVVDSPLKALAKQSGAASSHSIH